MKVNLSVKNMDLTPAMEEYVNDKIEALNKHGVKILQTDVQIEVSKAHQHADDMFRAEVMIQIPKKTLRAEHAAGDMYESFDLALPKLERQLEKHKDKGKLRDRKFLSRLGTVFSPFANRTKPQQGEVTERTKMNTEKSLSEAEAKIELSQSSEKFLVFHNTDNENKLSVITQHGDGAYKITEER